MSTQDFHLLVSYKEIGRTVTNEELISSFHRLLDSMVYADVYHDDWLDYNEDLDRQRESLEREILSYVSPHIRHILRYYA